MKDEINGIENLYADLLSAWNRRDAKAMAGLFADEGYAIGFDGSQYNGKAQFEAGLRKIFTDHETGAYVWKIRETRFLNPTVCLLRAIAGMVPPEDEEINPATNAFQTLVLVKYFDAWRIELFQNTPAQFHGRPELNEALTLELQQASEVYEPRP